MMISDKLRQPAYTYWTLRRAQEADHTNPALDIARTEAHDALLLALDRAGIAYASRDHAAQLAQAILEGYTPDALSQSSALEVTHLQQQLDRLKIFYLTVTQCASASTPVTAAQIEDWTHELQETLPTACQDLVHWLSQVSQALHNLENQELLWQSCQRSLFETEH